MRTLNLDTAQASALCPQVFSMTSMAALRRKSRLLTGYLEHLVWHKYGEDSDRSGQGPTVHIITPSDPEQRGCQLSLSFSIQIKRVFEELEKRGVAVSVRLLLLYSFTHCVLFCILHIVCVLSV